MYILVECDMLSITTCTSRLNAVKRRRKIYMTACTRSTVKGLKHNHNKVILRDNMTIRLYTDKITNNIHLFQFQFSLLIKGNMKIVHTTSNVHKHSINIYKRERVGRLKELGQI